MFVNIKLGAGAKMPVYKTEGSAACDVFTPDDFELQPGRNVIPLNIYMEFSSRYQALIEARSGFSVRGIEAEYNGIRSNIDADVIPGKIDSDYRGNVGVIIKYNGFHPVIIPKGTRIAQMTFVPIERACFTLVNHVEDLHVTERGDGGFGHTGAR